MRFTQAIDKFIADQRMYGRINSDKTELSYRSRLYAHAEDINNRDPHDTNRNDVKNTLRRWTHPNTQRNAHAIMVAFYKWAVEEGIRKDNPAEQVRRAKKRPTAVYRLTRDECEALLALDGTLRERAILQLGLLAGLRVQEMRGIQLKHFLRPGWIHVSQDIAKGGKERWVPVLSELEPLVQEIKLIRQPDQYVICGRRCINVAWSKWADDPTRPASPRAVWQAAGELAKRAGISAHIHPHLLRHGFGDHVARYAGLRAAQALLGHADVSTTQGTYVGDVTLDELAVSVQGFRYQRDPQRPPLSIGVENPHKAPTRIELVDSATGVVEPYLLAVLPSDLAARVASIDLFGRVYA
jgi:site-specific recombinase XerD